MATNTLPLPSPNFRSFTPTFSTIDDSKTPANAFLQRKTAFTDLKKGFYHYKFDSSHGDGSLTSNNLKPSIKRQKSRRSTMNICFNIPKNNAIDPYVSASNWLPKFKAHILGYLARERFKKLKEQNKAVLTIQNAFGIYKDPCLRLLKDINDLLKHPSPLDLRQLLKECIVHIKQLKTEQVYIEKQLDEVDDVIKKSMEITMQSCLEIEGHKASNPFKDVNSINYNANNAFIEDPLIQKVISKEIPGLENIDKMFDTTVCANTKVLEVYENSDKLFHKIHEDKHSMKRFHDQMEYYKLENETLRKEKLTAENYQKDLLKKYESDISIEREKNIEVTKNYEELAKLKNSLQLKLKENDGKLQRLTEIKSDLEKQCSDLTNEAMNKSKKIDKLTEEKNRLDRLLKEQIESSKYNQELLNEMESNMRRDKARMNDIKQRHLDQIKGLEDELDRMKQDSRKQLCDVAEINEVQIQQIVNLEAKIRRLEKEREDLDEQDYASDCDKGRDKILENQLSTAKLELEHVKEELKTSESINAMNLSQIEELDKKITKLEEEKLDLYKKSEKHKTLYNTLQTQFGETELQLNRANREKRNANQKLNTLNNRVEELENQISKLNETNNLLTQESHKKDREITELNLQFDKLKREINFLERSNQNLISDNDNKVKEKEERIKSLEQEYKKKQNELERKIDDLEYKIFNSESNIDQLESDKHDLGCQISKLKRRIKEQDRYIEEVCAENLKLKNDKNALEDQLSPSSSFSANSTLERRSVQDSLTDNFQSSNSDRSYSTLPSSRNYEK